MLLYKRIDIVTQGVLMIAVVLVFITGLHFNPLAPIISLGFVQVVSALVHAIGHPGLRKSRPRKIYYALLAIAGVSFVAIITWDYKENSYDGVLGLLIFSAYTLCMALYYFLLCWRELNGMRQIN